MALSKKGSMKLAVIGTVHKCKLPFQMGMLCQLLHFFLFYFPCLLLFLDCGDLFDVQNILAPGR